MKAVLPLLKDALSLMTSCPEQSRSVKRRAINSTVYVHKSSCLSAHVDEVISPTWPGQKCEQFPKKSVALLHNRGGMREEGFQVLSLTVVFVDPLTSHGL